MNALSSSESLLTLPLWNNMILVYAIALSMALHFSLLYTPILQGIFGIVPRLSEQEKRTMNDKPLLKLSSTYIKKASDIVPRCADRGPWKARSYYFKDIWIAWFGDIKSGMEWVRGV